MSKNWQMIDMATGEITVGHQINVFQRKQTDWAFIMLGLDGLKKISLDHDLVEADLRVFLWLSSEATYELIIRASQVHIAESIGIDRSTVARAIKRLEAGKYIKCMGKVFSLSPAYARKGKSKPKFWDDGGEK